MKIESENDNSNSYEVAFGKPWTEEEFVIEAHRRGHPAHLYQSLSDSMLQAIDANVKMKPVDIVEHRAKWLRKWMSRAVELKGPEEELHAKMPAERKLILARKRILLLREILEAEGYPDISICDDLAKGFPLVGLCATLSIADFGGFVRQRQQEHPALYKRKWRPVGGLRAVA